MAADDAVELDRLDGAPHPRETVELFGQDKAEAQFLDAYRSGRMPHAWLITGPEGAGKATFAWRAARFVLGNPDPQSAQVKSAGSLATDPNDPTTRKVQALSHPDLLFLRREMRHDSKAVPTEIRVDQVRKALSFFGSTAGSGGWRVAIIDSMDELNRSGANALLKLIEEPPPRSLILMVSSTPGRLLPTIRSRCRVLRLAPLSANDLVSALIQARPDVSEANAKKAARHAEGSVRMGLAFLDPDRLSIIEHVEATLSGLPDLDENALLQMANGLNARDKTADFETMLETIDRFILDMCRTRAGEGARRLAPLGEVWEKKFRSAREVDAFNLDRRPIVLSLFNDLADAMRLVGPGQKY